MMHFIVLALASTSLVAAAPATKMNVSKDLNTRQAGINLNATGITNDAGSILDDITSATTGSLTDGLTDITNDGTETLDDLTGGITGGLPGGPTGGAGGDLISGLLDAILGPNGILCGLLDAILGPNGILGGLLGGKFKVEDMSEEEVAAVKKVGAAIKYLRDDLISKGM